MQVILDELRQITAAPLNLPMSDEPRLRKVLEAMLAAPEDARTLEQWAKSCGAAPRTLSRLFVQQLGMSFGEWRTRLRMLEAIERLGGRTIKVPFERWWRTMEESSYSGLEGLFVHPVENEKVMAGNGTIGLEIVEDLPPARLQYSFARAPPDTP